MCVLCSDRGRRLQGRRQGLWLIGNEREVGLGGSCCFQPHDMVCVACRGHLVRRHAPM